MPDVMMFPDTVEEFMESYKMVDVEHVYSNGVEFVPIYRMMQWFQHRPERKTGNWIIDDDWNMCDIEGTLIGTKEFECDQCGYRELAFDGTVTHLNYCPNCGADMRGAT